MSVRDVIHTYSTHLEEGGARIPRITTIIYETRPWHPSSTFYTYMRVSGWGKTFKK